MHRLVLVAGLALAACDQTANDRPQTLTYITEAILQPSCAQHVCHSSYARTTSEVMAIVWPGAEKLGPEDGKPPAIAVYRGGRIAGYIFSTLDVVHAPGFSGTPFDVIAGTSTGALLAAGLARPFRRGEHHARAMLFADAYEAAARNIFPKRSTLGRRIVSGRRRPAKSLALEQILEPASDRRGSP